MAFFSAWYQSSGINRGFFVSRSESVKYFLTDFPQQKNYNVNCLDYQPHSTFLWCPPLQVKNQTLFVLNFEVLKSVTIIKRTSLAKYFQKTKNTVLMKKITPARNRKHFFYINIFIFIDLILILYN